MVHPRERQGRDRVLDELGNRHDRSVARGLRNNDDDDDDDDDDDVDVDVDVDDSTVDELSNASVCLTYSRRPRGKSLTKRF